MNGSLDQQLALPGVFIQASVEEAARPKKALIHVKLFDDDRFAIACSRDNSQQTSKKNVKLRINVDGRVETCSVKIEDLARQLQLTKSQIVASAEKGVLESLLLTWKNYLTILNGNKLTSPKISANELIEKIQHSLHSLEENRVYTIDKTGIVAFKNRMTHLTSLVPIRDLKSAEILGIGKFGTVWKVADLTDRDFFAFKTTALSVLDHLKEDAIQSYFEASQRNLENEFQIVRELNPDGTVVGIELPAYGKLVLLRGEVKYKGILKAFYEQSIQLPIERKEFSLKEKMAVCNQLITGFCTLYSKGIWFADIKTDNVRQFLLPDGSCRYDLCDLGSACKYGAIDPKNLGAYTPYYFPLEDRQLIEQTENREIVENVCRAQSCFALGVVLFEVMTSQKPFFQQEQKTIKYPIIPEDLKRQKLELLDSFGDLSQKKELTTIILGMLNKNYKERAIPANASQLFKIASE